MVRSKNTARKSTTQPAPVRSPRLPPTAGPVSDPGPNFCITHDGDRRQDPTDPNGAPRQRYRPGVGAVMEIMRYQHSTELLIPKLPFQRVIREVMLDLAAPDLRIQVAALEALQVADADKLLILAHLEPFFS